MPKDRNDLPPPIAETSDVRHGLNRLSGWLELHPDLPVAWVGFVDSGDAVIRVPAGRHETLGIAADIADALTEPTIRVEAEQPATRIARLTVMGFVDAATTDVFEIHANVDVYDTAAADLLASLGTPPIPNLPHWTTTVAHLRTLTIRAGA